LIAHRIGQRRLGQSAVDDLFRRLNRDGRTAKNVGGPPFDGGGQVGPRNHFVDEAERFAFRSPDLASGEDHSKRGLQADLPRQAMQSAAQRNGANQRLRQAEQRGPV